MGPVFLPPRPHRQVKLILIEYKYIVSVFWHPHNFLVAVFCWMIFCNSLMLLQRMMRGCTRVFYTTLSRSRAG